MIMIKIESKHNDIGGCKLHWLEAGDRQGDTVLLLHGMKFQAATWQELGSLELLARNGFHVIAIDMPGFGDSPVCDRDTDEVLTAFVRQHGISPLVLVGPSMGGRIALEFSLAHPDLVSALVLVGPVGVADNEDRLATISRPVLAIWGSEDQIAPLEHCNLLQQHIRNCRCEVIQGAPHPCYLDQPEAWHRLVLDFLQEIRKETEGQQTG